MLKQKSHDLENEVLTSEFCFLSRDILARLGQ